MEGIALVRILDEATTCLQTIVANRDELRKKSSAFLENRLVGIIKLGRRGSGMSVTCHQTEYLLVFSIKKRQLLFYK